MFQKATIAGGILLVSSMTGEASMNDRIVTGEILDQRVAQCGVRIDGTEIATLRPFIEMSEALTGTFRINVTKRSRSGTSMTSQSNRFANGSLGETVLAVDRPSTVVIDMQVNGTDGKIYCRVNAEIELEEPSIRL
jgi:hypothetical protein